MERALVEVAAHGRWSRRVQVETTRAISKCFAEGPRAVLIDLHDLGDPAGASAATWWAAATRGAELQPAVRVVLSVPETAPLAARLRRLDSKRHLPVYATLNEARAAVHIRLPPVERHQLRLQPCDEAAAAARQAVDAVCEAWSLPALQYPGRLAISELLDNAVVHAGTEMTVMLTRRGNGLHLAVSDGSRRLPRLLAALPTSREGVWEERGLGLRAVDRIATVWGAMPTATGKVVWALIGPR
ncbi:ATP-binding protein [Actinoplanes nipponensis]|nr:ATP-binding protein [Actinoplanes nipponensis]